MNRALALFAIASIACEASPAPVPMDPDPPAVESARTFGRAPSEEIPITPLASILSEPERYRDQVVRTEGEIAQVCQRMGCWMELRQGADGSAPPGRAVRVPMAGHSFFLPRDVAGRRAMLEGRVALADLAPHEREHLEGEGATATGSALSIEATGVVVR